MPSTDVSARRGDFRSPTRADDPFCVAARTLLGGYGLSTRDALHMAVMEDAGITRIMTFDTGFDAYPGIERLS